MRSLFAVQQTQVTPVDHDAYRAFTNHYKTTTDTYADSPAFTYHRKAFENGTTSEHALFDAAVSVRSHDAHPNAYRIYLDNVLFGDAQFDRPHLLIRTPLSVDTLTLSDDLHIENIRGRVHEHVRGVLNTYRERSPQRTNRELAHDLERFGAFLERHTVTTMLEWLRSTTNLSRRIGVSFKRRHVICHDHHVVIKRPGYERHVAVYGDVGTSVVVYSHLGDFTLTIDPDVDFTHQVADGLLLQQDRLEQVRRRFLRGLPPDTSREDVRSLLALRTACQLKDRFDNLLDYRPLALKDDPFTFARLACTVSQETEDGMKRLFEDLHHRIDLSVDYTPANLYGVSDLNWATLYQSGRLTHDVCGALLLDHVRIGQIQFREPSKLQNLSISKFLQRYDDYDLVHFLGRVSFRGGSTARERVERLDSFLAGGFDRDMQVFLSDTTQTMVELASTSSTSHHQQLRGALARRLSSLEDLHHARTHIRF